MICKCSRVIDILWTSCRKVHLCQAASVRQLRLGGRSRTGQQVAKHRKQTFRGISANHFQLIPIPVFTS